MMLRQFEAERMFCLLWPSPDGVLPGENALTYRRCQLGVKLRGGNDQVVHELARRVRSSIKLEH